MSNALALLRPINWLPLSIHVESCLPLSIGADPGTVLAVAAGGKTKFFGCRKGVVWVSIGCR